MGRGEGGEAAGLPCRRSWLQTWLRTCAVGAAFVVLVPWRNQNATQRLSLRVRGSRGQEAGAAGALSAAGIWVEASKSPRHSPPGAGAFCPVIHGEPPPLPKENSLSSEKRHGRASVLEGRAPLLVPVDELTAGAPQPAPGKSGKFVCSLCWEGAGGKAARSLLCRLSLSHPRQILPGFPPGSLNPNSSPWRGSWHGFRGKRGGFWVCGGARGPGTGAAGPMRRPRLGTTTGSPGSAGSAGAPASAPRPVPCSQVPGQPPQHRRTPMAALSPGPPFICVVSV